MSNKNSTSLRRIRADLRELTMDKNSSDRYTASPLEHDMFEWHFTIRGPVTTDFENGIYHGRILLPPDYPYKPPHIMFLTPNGRFDTNTKICLSFSAYHPELWQPAWGIRLILEALIAFLPTPTDGAIGAIDYSSAERKKLAIQSQQYFCPTCQCHPRTLLRAVPQKSDNDQGATAGENATCQPVTASTLRFQKEIEELQRLQFLQHSKKEDTPKETEVRTEEKVASPVSSGNLSLNRANEESNGNQQQRQQQERSTDDTEKIEETVIPKEGLALAHEAPTRNGNTAVHTQRNSNIADTTVAGTTPTNTTNTNHTATTNHTMTMMDHIVNGSMILFAIICAILLHTIQVLLLEIRDLTSSSSS
jgi:ubiquitin-conjugating enzyme E2 J1